MIRIQPYLSALVGLVIVAVAAAEFARRPGVGNAEPFHTAAAKAIAAIPMEFGPWESSSLPVPASAQTLLKPNAILSRSLRNKQTGEQASLVLVQCRDTRDMAGHYPPICYPGQGWTEVEPRSPVQLVVGKRTVTAIRYEFTRSGFDRDRMLVVYNFFAIPGQGTPADMDTIRRAAADYPARPFGAAQVQVVLGRRMPADEEHALIENVLSPLADVVDLLSDPRWRR